MKEESKRTKLITIRLTEYEYKLLSKYAKSIKIQMSISQVCRKIIFNFLVKLVEDGYYENF